MAMRRKLSRASTSSDPSHTRSSRLSRASSSSDPSHARSSQLSWASSTSESSRAVLSSQSSGASLTSESSRAVLSSQSSGASLTSDPSHAGSSDNPPCSPAACPVPQARVASVVSTGACTTHPAPQPSPPALRTDRCAGVEHDQPARTTPLLEGATANRAFRKRAGRVSGPRPVLGKRKSATSSCGSASGDRESETAPAPTPEVPNVQDYALSSDVRRKSATIPAVLRTGASAEKRPSSLFLGLRAHARRSVETGEPPPLLELDPDSPSTHVLGPIRATNTAAAGAVSALPRPSSSASSSASSVSSVSSPSPPPPLGSADTAKQWQTSASKKVRSLKRGLQKAISLGDPGREASSGTHTHDQEQCRDSAGTPKARTLPRPEEDDKEELSLFEFLKEPVAANSTGRPVRDECTDKQSRPVRDQEQCRDSAGTPKARTLPRPKEDDKEELSLFEFLKEPVAANSTGRPVRDECTDKQSRPVRDECTDKQSSVLVEDRRRRRSGKMAGTEDTLRRTKVNSPPERIKDHYEILKHEFSKLKSCLHAGMTTDDFLQQSSDFCTEFNKANNAVLQLMASVEWKDVFEHVKERVDSKLASIHTHYAEFISFIDNFLIQSKPVPADDAVSDYVMPLQNDVMTMLADLSSIYDDHSQQQSMVPTALAPTQSAPSTLGRYNSDQSQTSLDEDGAIKPYMVFSQADQGPVTVSRSATERRPRSAHGQNKIEPVSSEGRGSPSSRAKRSSLPSSSVHAISKVSDLPTPYASSHVNNRTTHATSPGAGRRAQTISLASNASVDSADSFVLVDEFNSVAVERPRLPPPVPMAKSQSDVALLQSRSVNIPPKLPPKKRGMSASQQPSSASLPPGAISAPSTDRQPPPLPEKKKARHRPSMVPSRSFEFDSRGVQEVQPSSSLPFHPPKPTHDYNMVHPRPPASQSQHNAAGMVHSPSHQQHQQYQHQQHHQQASSPAEPDGYASMFGNRPQALAELPADQMATLASSLERGAMPPPPPPPPAADEDSMSIYSSYNDSHLYAPVTELMISSSSPPATEILGTGVGQRHMSMLDTGMTLTASSCDLATEETVVSSSSTNDLESSLEVGGGGGRRGSGQLDSAAPVSSEFRGRSHMRLPPSTCVPGVRAAARARQPSPPDSPSSDSDSVNSSPSLSRSTSPSSRSPAQSHSQSPMQSSPQRTAQPLPRTGSPFSAATGSPRHGRRHSDNRSHFPRLPSPSSNYPRPSSPSAASHLHGSLAGYLEERNISPTKGPGPPVPMRENRRTSEQVLSATQRTQLEEQQSSAAAPPTASLTSVEERPLQGPPPLPKKTKHLSHYGNQIAMVPEGGQEAIHVHLESFYGSTNQFGIAVNRQAMDRTASNANRPASLYVAAASLGKGEFEAQPQTRQRTGTVSGRALANPPALPPKKKRLSGLVNGGDLSAASTAGSSQRFSSPPPALPPRATLPRPNTSLKPSVVARASSAEDVFAAGGQQQQPPAAHTRRLPYAIQPPDVDLPPPPPPLESPPPPPPPDDEYESSSGYSFPQTEGSGAVDRQGNLPETATGDTTQEVGTVAEEQEEKEEEIPPLFREDVYDELIFEENDDDVKPLRGGTVETLVAFAASGSVDQAGALGAQYVNVFLATHRPFLSPSALLDMLLSREAHFKNIDTPDGRKSRQQTLFLILRIIPLLRMKRYQLDGTEIPSELESNVLNKLQKTVYNLICFGQLQLALILRNSLIKKVLTPIRKDALDLVLAQTKGMKPPDGSLRSALMKFSAKQVAMQITLIDDIFVQGIDEQEMLLYSRKQESKDVPTWDSYTQHTNRVPAWLVTRIFESPKQRDRDKYFKFLLKILHALMKLDNVSTAMQTYCMMKNRCVERLWWGFSYDELMEKNKLSKLIDTSRSFQKYRNYIKEAMKKNEPVMLFLTRMMGDLTLTNQNEKYLHTGNPAEDGKYLNYCKQLRQFSILSQFHKSRLLDYTSKYGDKKNLEIWSIFDGFRDVMNMDEMYDSSKKLAPTGRPT